jgi:valyl-tRNA synthetase
MLTSFPQGDAALLDQRSEDEMQAVIDLISRVRNIRSEMNIKPGERLHLIINADDRELRGVFEASREQITRLARASDIQMGAGLPVPKAAARAILAGGAEVAVPLEGLIDFERETARLTRELEKLSKEASGLEKQLGNPQFVERAPAAKVNELRERLEEIVRRTGALRQTLEALK